MSETNCQSCSMTIESGDYCEHCTADDGALIGFEECVERFSQWARRREPELDAAAARAKTLDFMASMPAWREHPDLLAARGQGG